MHVLALLRNCCQEQHALGSCMLLVSHDQHTDVRKTLPLQLLIFRSYQLATPHFEEIVYMLQTALSSEGSGAAKTVALMHPHVIVDINEQT